MLAGALEQARRGQAPTVFVGGEAGIGKSRLLDEFAVTAAGAGAGVLVGGCAPLGQSPPPLTPIVEALRAHLRSAGPAERSRLAHLAPALTRLLPELVGTQDIWQRFEDLESGQGWVFDLLLGALEALAAERPLVLVLEDLHWADQSTLDLVALRTQTSRVAGCVVVATYRSDELAAGDPLRLLLAELERSGRIERVDLRPFARGELIAQMTGILGALPGRNVMEDVFARSDGNPFFAEELLAAGGRAGSGSTLQDVLLARIETLPEPTQTVLRILSAARRSLSHQALAAVSGTAERDLESALRRAVARHVLVATADGGYAFRHALMREAVYARLLPAERVRLHGEIARAIDAHRAMSGETDPQLLADLAYHWHFAGNHPPAFAAAVAAGLAADDIHAHAEALTQYERALQLWDSVSQPERLAGMDRISLRARAAEAASNRGESGHAIRLVEEAIDETDPDADPTRAGLLTERLGRYRWIGGETADALAAFEQAVRIVPASPPSVERARVLAALAHAQLISSRTGAARASASEALHVARAAVAPVEEGRALSTLGAANADHDEGVRMVRAGRALLEFAGAAADFVFMTFGYETGLLDSAGRFDDALEAARAGIEFTGRHGMHRNHQTWLEAIAASTLIKLGQWAEADTILESAIQKGPTGITRLAVQLSRAELQLARGEPAAAAESAADGRRAVQGDLPLAGRRFEILAALDLAHRRFDSARANVGEGLAVLQQLDDPQAAGHLCWRGLQVEATRAERARAGKRAAEEAAALVVATDLLDRVCLLAAERPAIVEITALSHTCQAELARGRGAPSADAWLTAAAAWCTLREPYPDAYCRLRAAEAALAERKPKGEAAVSLRSAHATAERLQAVPLLEAAESIARRARVDIAPLEAESAREADNVTAVKPLGLTSRELQVLRLVSEGHTNPQIANALFISRKTASAHVSNILAKLGVARRVEAAAMAERLDLLYEPKLQVTA